VADSTRFLQFVSAGISLSILALAGVLGSRGILSTEGVVALAGLAVGSFVVVALKVRWKKIRLRGGEIEL